MYSRQNWGNDSHFNKKYFSKGVETNHQLQSLWFVFVYELDICKNIPTSLPDLQIAGRHPCSVSSSRASGHSAVVSGPVESSRENLQKNHLIPSAPGDPSESLFWAGF